jgi:uncharacterized protein (TIGR01777 family)
MNSIPEKNIFTVLITGGSGLVGRYVTSALLSKGYKVIHLSRKASHFGRVRVYRWDPEKQIIDPAFIENVDYVIHLAGANIGEKRWSAKRKEDIIKSRVDSAKFLYEIIKERRIKLKAYISASGVGYYGSEPSEKIYSETDPPGKDFIGTTCRLWEVAAELFQSEGIRTVKIRSGLVLEKNNGAFKRFLFPAKFGLFPVIGNGRHIMSWIHIKDISSIYLKVLEDNNFEGAYNAVSPGYVSYYEFVRTLAQVMKRPFFHFPVPAFGLKILLGEMSEIVLKGSRISSKKIINAGFQFTFASLHDALENVVDSE